MYMCSCTTCTICIFTQCCTAYQVLCHTYIDICCNNVICTIKSSEVVNGRLFPSNLHKTTQTEHCLMQPHYRSNKLSSKTELFFHFVCDLQLIEYRSVCTTSSSCAHKNIRSFVAHIRSSCAALPVDIFVLQTLFFLFSCSFAIH